MKHDKPNKQINTRSTFNQRRQFSIFNFQYKVDFEPEEAIFMMRAFFLLLLLCSIIDIDNLPNVNDGAEE